ncbi:SecY interacting protein Syd [Gilliamella bombicola]|uniref:SecY interacting protein Syd n=1 Tax=Gilliamella bombicola TaxID=1798182 RepID=A0A1C4D0L5_9GAMM|nr:MULTISPECIES: SecY-interacting protein [Gilliamella]NUF28363.1 SecY-interacting protein [Gilliamella sp. ESL0254]SCC24768.1 SecY interacting protein Syd [Gilliamella bombicola]
MDSTDKTALLNFTTRWIEQFKYAPQSEDLHAIPSPCILKTEKLTVYWQPFLLEPPRNLTIIEQVIGIKLHPSTHIFYGTQYAGNMTAKFNDTNLVLIQAWNDDDFSNLEQNLIAHLSQQKRLKRIPTIFIASTDDSTKIISINNLTGEVVKEDLITGELTTLTNDLISFFNQITIFR